MDCHVDCPDGNTALCRQLRPGNIPVAVGKKSLKLLELVALFRGRIFPPQLSHGPGQNGERPASFEQGFGCQKVSRFEQILGFAVISVQREWEAAATTPLRSSPLPLV